MIIPRSLVHAFWAVLFTALFFSVGWQSLNPYAFPDLAAYREGFESGWYIFTSMNRSPLDFLLNEGVWAHLFDVLYSYVGDIDRAFLIVSAASLILICIFIIRRTDSFWYLLFLLNPAFVNLVVEQIRSGLAAGLFWIAVSTKNRPLKILLMLLAGSIHTAFFLFAGIYFLYHIARQFELIVSVLRRPLLAFALLAAAAVVGTVFRETILVALGDQRAYQVVEYTSGIFLALAWISFIISYFIFRQEKQFSFEPAFFAFNVVTALLSAVIGLYGSRFTAISIPALAVMASKISPAYRMVFTLQYILFSLLYFYFWFD